MPADSRLKRPRSDIDDHDDVGRRDRDRKRSRRSRSRSVEKPRSPDRKRHRERSTSPKRGDFIKADIVKRTKGTRSRSTSPSRNRRDRHSKPEKTRKPAVEEKAVAAPVMAMDDTDADAMAQLMGFTSFDSTKGKKVEGNDVGATTVAVKRKYRQYMNRRGGFNRPLDPVL